MLDLEVNGHVVLLVNACSSRDLKENAVGVCFVAQDVTSQKILMDNFTRVQGDPNALIPPLFIMDAFGCCSEWNSAMEKLSGMKRKDVTGKVLVGEVFCLNGFGCQVKDHNTLTKLRIVLNSVMAGQEADKFLFGFFGQHGRYVEGLLSTNKRIDEERRIDGVLCFLRLASPELQHALQVQQVSEQSANNRLKELAYIRQELRNPLNGIMFTHKLMENSTLTKEQNQLLRTSVLCQHQLAKILDDMDLESIEDCYLELNTVKFNLGEVLVAVTTYKSGNDSKQRRQVRLLHDWPSEVSSMYLYGDNLRLQQVLAGFLLNAL